jgi:ABC-2 type transport system ATP-binding protein
VALLGPNGAGKTTLVRSILGLLKPEAGRVAVAGGDPAIPAVRRNLGVVQQEVGFPKTLTVQDVVMGAVARSGASRDAAGSAMREMGLDGLEHRRAASLSGGQQQRLQLAMGLVADPLLLVLDEPTVGLDVEARASFWSAIRRRRDSGAGVLLTTHLVDEAGAVANRIAVIDRGSIVVEGTPSDLRRTLPDREIEATTEIDVAELRALDGVGAVERLGPRVRINATQAESIVRWMLAHDPELTDLTISTASLDDVLLDLTRKATA